MQLGFSLILIGSGALGCQHTCTPPSDPIFVSKKPLLSRPELKPPALMVFLEPEAAAAAGEAVAARPCPSGPETVPVRLVRGQAP
jgi:hypothetical protein